VGERNAGGLPADADERLAGARDGTSDATEQDPHRADAIQRATGAPLLVSGRVRGGHPELPEAFAPRLRTAEREVERLQGKLADSAPRAG
jgi:hypothetical protein